MAIASSARSPPDCARPPGFQRSWHWASRPGSSTTYSIAACIGCPTLKSAWPRAVSCAKRRNRDLHWPHALLLRRRRVEVRTPSLTRTHQQRLRAAHLAIEGLSIGDAVGRQRLLDVAPPPWRYSDDTEM